MQSFMAHFFCSRCHVTLDFFKKINVQYYIKMSGQSFFKRFPLLLLCSFVTFFSLSTFGNETQPTDNKTEGNKTSHMSTKTVDDSLQLQETNFNKDFVGVTLNMDEDESLKSDELKRLLLCTFKHFNAVEIVIQKREQLTTLLETVSSNFKAIHIITENVSLSISPTANNESIIAEIVSNLDKQGFKVHHHHQQNSRPTISNTFIWNSCEQSPLGIYIGFGVALSIFIIILIFIIKTCRYHRYLSAKEVNDFLHGRQEILQEAAKKRKRYSRRIFNVFHGLMYHKEFEISKWNINLNRKSTLSCGVFTKVYQAKVEGSEQDFAVEVCSKRLSKDRFRAMLSEIKMLCYIGNHANIVGFIGCYTKEIRKGVLWIVKEYCNGGDLLEYLQMSKEGNDCRICVSEMIRFAKEIACGMEYLSRQNVIHGDLRAKHVQLDHNKTCKVGNFGLPTKLVEYQMLVEKEMRDKLPWRWMAPEALQNMEFSIHSDVWSYGVTIWEVFSLGEVPHGTASTAFFDFIVGLEHGNRLAIPSHATSEIHDIIRKCWTLEPHERPSFEELFKFFLEISH